jgi:hypothetical protein
VCVTCRQSGGNNKRNSCTSLHTSMANEQSYMRNQTETSSVRNRIYGARLRWGKRGTERGTHREGRGMLAKLEEARKRSDGRRRRTDDTDEDPCGRRGGRRQTRRLDEPGRGRCRAMWSLTTSNAGARRNQRRPGLAELEDELVLSTTQFRQLQGIVGKVVPVHEKEGGGGGIGQGGSPRSNGVDGEDGDGRRRGRGGRLCRSNL